MKNLNRAICLVLALVLCLSLAACTPTPDTEPESTLSPEEQILADRRDAAEAYMRELLTVKWRATKDIEYQLSTGVALEIKAGRIYSGLPYSFGYGTKAAFLELAGKPDEKGIYTISGLEAGALNGGTGVVRFGNDCCSALALAWGSIGATLTHSTTAKIHSEHGYLPVGDYDVVIEDGKMVNTKADILNNGREKMYNAYAQLQKADGMVKYGGGNPHVVMVIDVDVVYAADGSIDPDMSSVTILEQTRNNQRNGICVKDESLGEDVYIIGGLDRKLTFDYIAKEGYLPITCKEFIDPSLKETPSFTDSETTFNKDIVLSGTITSNWAMDTVTITIMDASGQEIQKIAASSMRYSNQIFDLQQFLTDDPASIRGSMDLTALAAGNYRCTLVCRLVSGEEFTVRDFDFTV